MTTKKLSAKELAALFVEYRELYDKLLDLETKIVEQTIKQGETQKIAGVTATYYKPTEKVDYETAARTQENLPVFEYTVSNNSETKVITSWKSVCSELGIDLTPFTVSHPARVVVKVKAGQDD